MQDSISPTVKSARPISRRRWFRISRSLRVAEAVVLVAEESCRDTAKGGPVLQRQLDVLAQGQAQPLCVPLQSLSLIFAPLFESGFVASLSLVPCKQILVAPRVGRSSPFGVTVIKERELELFLVLLTFLLAFRHNCK